MHNSQNFSKNNKLTPKDILVPWDIVKHPSADAYLNVATKDIVQSGLICGALNDQATKRYHAFSHLCTLVFNDATMAGMLIAGGFNDWLFFLDDHYDNKVGLRGEALMDLMETNRAILLGKPATGDTPLERFGAIVHRRFSIGTKRWWCRFEKDLNDYLFRGSYPAVETMQKHEILDPETYRIRRRFDSSVLACLDVMELAYGLDLPDPVLSPPEIRRLRLLTTEHVAFVNDIFSYHKEVVLQESTFNLLFVLMHHHRIQLDEAVHLAVDMLNAQVVEFESIVETIRQQTPALHAEAKPYIDGMRNWIAGNFAFSASSRRYIHPDSDIEALRAPWSKI